MRLYYKGNGGIASFRQKDLALFDWDEPIMIDMENLLFRTSDLVSGIKPSKENDQWPPLFSPHSLR